MASFAQLIAVLLSGPACTLWLAILFREPISDVLGRLRVLKISREAAESRFDPTKPRRPQRKRA